MSIRAALLTVCLLLLPGFVKSQTLDAQSFEDAVNKAIGDMPGVSFEALDGAKVSIFENENTDQTFFGSGWLASIAENAPQFGFVVNDKNGWPVDVIGGQVPFQIMGGEISITGYKLPEGYTVATVGTAGFLEAASAITQRVEAPSDDVEKAVQTVKGASAYILQELCTSVGRPTEITLNLTAGFKLAFSVETGSRFHWDLEVVCARQ
jgi:hypothetical protein